MQKICDVKLIVAISLSGCGEGCVVQVIEGSTEVETDAQEYGADLNSFFFEGAEKPRKAGVYLFTGAAHGVLGSDSVYRYCGEFHLPNPTE